MARDVGRAGRGNEPRGRVALVTVGFAVLVRVVDHDAQPRTESLELTHDFRIGQVIGKDIGQHFGVGLAFVEEVEKNAGASKPSHGYGLPSPSKGTVLKLSCGLPTGGMIFRSLGKLRS